MSETIGVTINAGITDGPSLRFNQTISVTAYDKIDIQVPSGGVPMNVDLQPGDAGKVRFLFVTSDAYGDTVTYKVNDPKDVPFPLDGPIMLIGLSAVRLLDPAPKNFIFENNSPKACPVHILIGRNAT